MIAKHAESPTENHMRQSENTEFNSTQSVEQMNIQFRYWVRVAVTQ
jgi:hypothetical protein